MDEIGPWILLVAIVVAIAFGGNCSASRDEEKSKSRATIHNERVDERIHHRQLLIYMNERLDGIEKYLHGRETLGE